jgi:hypothetical protein
MSKRNKNNATYRKLSVGGLRQGNTEAEAKSAATELQKSAGKLPPPADVIPIETAARHTLHRPSTPEHVERLIRQRAYELYERRGREDGHAEEDWLRAEAEIVGTVFRRASTG